MIWFSLGLALAVSKSRYTDLDINALDRISSPASIQSALLSPDGNLIYVLDGSQHLWVYRADTMKAEAGPMDWPRTTFSFFPTRTRGVVVALDVEGGAPHIVLRNVLQSGSAASKLVSLPGRIAGFSNPLGGDVRVITQVPRGGWFANVIDSETGQFTSSPLPGFSHDFAFAPGNRPIAALVASSSGTTWQPLDCKTSSCSPLDGNAQPALGGVINGLSDGTGINVRWHPEDTGVVAFWAWGQGQPRELGRVPGADVSDVLVAPSSGEIQAIAGGIFEKRWHSLDPRAGTALRHLQAHMHGYPRVLDRTADSSAWLVAEITDQTPPVFSLYVPRADKLVRLPGQPAAQPMPAATTAWVDARDGVRVPVYLSPPVRAACDITSETCGVVALVHGGPQHRDEKDFSQDVALLQQMGLWVLRVNYRGSTGFGSAFVNKGNGEWGRKISYDVIDALQWVGQKRGVDARRMCVAGTSFGGFTAINVASLRPDLVACAASLNGGGDLEQFATEVVRNHPDLAEGLARQLADPGTPAGLGEIRSQSPMSRLSALKMPLLLAYGVNDDTAPPSATTSLSDALRSRMAAVVTLAYPNESHLFSPAGQRSYRAALANFLANTIGARANIVLPDDEHSPRIVGVSALVRANERTSTRP